MQLPPYDGLSPRDRMPKSNSCMFDGRGGGWRLASLMPSPARLDAVETTAALATVGVALLGLLGYVVLDVVGQLAVDEAADALGRRPSFAARRRRNRGLMKAGLATVLLGATAGWMWLAAATSGYADTADDARVLGQVTAVLTVAGCVLLAVWWRRSGAPRHH